MVEDMRRTVVTLLQGIDRYNPENITTLEKYVTLQSKENAYDLEANLALLKQYQFGDCYNNDFTSQILLKALTNLPHTDFVLCKCLLNHEKCNESPIKEIIYLADLLERCDFQQFWLQLQDRKMQELCARIFGFQDSIRKFVCHVVGITFQTIQKPLLIQLLGGVDENTMKQWVQRYGWKEIENDMIFISNQDENIKTKNITEKIDFDSVAGIMASCT
ncbi:unnamed protein product [Nesidiocoris tenuis]|uniref:Eukaryotic translation initiation factor 3 subunit K n=2 Tax=Nesidiocoris tenuis TaxID=355587 RepID=A0A6H5GEX5_9HEMI|nr:Eukaryotic translation initiation factor 3 subunit F-1 [Nesidiocoris tenuis]CAB0001520.1 unnamed protein product [Nesidiocoris tenuis]CAB0020865.1 unnamed protein product [Nesidiocoris tenuis]